jgi:hypothetical protein
VPKFGRIKCAQGLGRNNEKGGVMVSPPEMREAIVPPHLGGVL